MPALGQKRTLGLRFAMSALPPKADRCQRWGYSAGRPLNSVGKLRRCKPQHNLCRTLTWKALADLHDGIKPREGVDLPAPFGRVTEQRQKPFSQRLRPA